MSCANMHCNNKHPHDELDAQLVSIDGDFACSKQCKKMYEQQRDKFFNEIVHSESLTTSWLNGDID